MPWLLIRPFRPAAMRCRGTQLSMLSQVKAVLILMQTISLPIATCADIRHGQVQKKYKSHCDPPSSRKHPRSLPQVLRIYSTLAYGSGQSKTFTMLWICGLSIFLGTASAIGGSTGRSLIATNVSTIPGAYIVEFANGHVCSISLKERGSSAYPGRA